MRGQKGGLFHSGDRSPFGTCGDLAAGGGVELLLFRKVIPSPSTSTIEKDDGASGAQRVGTCTDRSACTVDNAYTSDP